MKVLTVAIPTYNRAQVLRVTLEALMRVVVPESHDWEVVVVQNSCSDETPDVLREFATKLPLRPLVENRPGVNFARNAAVEGARGECIIFTDDDTEPDPGWLRCYATAFAEFPDVEVFGGPITPHFTTTPPPWLVSVLPEIAAAYGRLERGSRGDTFNDGFFPFGANMAFRTAVLRDAQFDGRLGPKGLSRINGSERELVLRLLARGAAGRWVEGARVKHHIHPKQMTSAFLRWYYTGQGASTPPDVPADTRMLWGRPRWLWRELVESELRVGLGKLRGRPDIWVRELKRASVARGRLTRRGTTFA